MNETRIEECRCGEHTPPSPCSLEHFSQSHLQKLSECVRFFKLYKICSVEFFNKFWKFLEFFGV